MIVYTNCTRRVRMPPIIIRSGSTIFPCQIWDVSVLIRHDCDTVMNAEFLTLHFFFVFFSVTRHGQWRRLGGVISWLKNILIGIFADEWNEIIRMFLDRENIFKYCSCSFRSCQGKQIVSSVINNAFTFIYLP